MEDSDHHHSGALVIGSNEDLLTEILIRLPVTSILRFKLVCKHWRLLLSNSHLTHRYDNNNLSKSPLGLFGDSDVYVPFDVKKPSPPPFHSLDFYFNRSDVRIKQSFSSLDFYFKCSNVRIEQSCNGLLLCSTPYNGASEYYVFNPTTKQLAFNPSVPKNICSMALAFHPTECVHYKAVCVTYLDSQEDMFRIQIYSSDTMKWKVCIESFSARVSDFHHPVYWNGSIHWAPRNLHRNFFYVKLDVEQLQILPVSEGLRSEELLTTYFGESRGHLHLIPITDDGHRISNVNVYEMLRDHSGWFVKYRVQFDERQGFPQIFSYKWGVVDVVRGKEEEETFLVLVTPRRLMRYNIHDKSFNMLYSETDYGDGDFYYHRSTYHRYVEALSSF